MSKQSYKLHYLVVFIFVLGFFARLTLAYFYYGYPNDIACFKGWSNMLFSNGMAQFYSSPEFTDYPPGYMYVLYILGAIRHAINVPSGSMLFTVMIKLPAIFFDMAAGLFVYLFAVKKTRHYMAIILTALYLFNPAVFINSAVWGQVDAVYTLIVILSIYCLTKDLLFRGFLLFTFAILIKPQSLIFSPVYLFYLYDVLCKNKFDKKIIIYIIKSGAICFFVIFLAILPFTQNFNFMPVFEQYVRTLASYPYASVNAYNLYTALGANWMPVENTFLFMSYSAWGFLFIVLIVAASFYLLYRRVDFFLMAALINFGTFILSIKMHERYIFPTLALLLISFIKNRSYYVLALFIALSTTLFINCKDILYLLANDNNLDLIVDSASIVSIINIGLFIFAIVCVLSKEVVIYKK